MASITLSDLREQVRQRADMSGSGFVTDSELTAYVNTSTSELYDILIQKYGDDYFNLDATYTTTANSGSYALPSAFYKATAVELLDSSSRPYARLRRYSDAERPYLANSSNFAGDVATGTNLRYRVQHGSLKILPAPAGGLTLRLSYIPRFTYMTGSADAFEFISGWEEYVIVDAAIKCLQKEESDVSVLMAQKQMLIQRIEAAAQNRDTAEPEKADLGYEDFWFRW